MKIDITALQLAPNTPALDAMRIIDEGLAQIALVVDQEQRLLGTLTDGDIRRGLLNGETLETPVEKLMNRKYRYVHIGEDRTAILKMMSKEVLHQIPVIDEKGRVVELLILQDMLSAVQVQKNPVVIMAGGKGSRLKQHTTNCPKPMLHVNGKPMLEILVEQCIDSGFRQFYISVNYLKEMIIDYFGDGKKWGVNIDYIIENEPLGTAGSLKMIPKSVREPLLVLNGDVLTKVNLMQILKFHLVHKAAATLCVREHITTIPYGVVKTNGVELTGFEEKPSYQQLVNAGVYVINPKLLSLLGENEYTDMPTLLDRALKEGQRVSVCPIHEYWIDIGRPETLEQAHQEWRLIANK